MRFVHPIAFIGSALSSFAAIGVVSLLWSKSSPSVVPAAQTSLETSSPERLRPVGLTGAINRQRREGALLVDLRGGRGRQISSAIAARVEELPRLIKGHFARTKVAGRRFVIIIGDKAQIARADQILAARRGFDVLRYLDADFIESRTSRFLDTDVPQLSPSALQHRRDRFAIIDIQLPHEQSVARLPGSLYLSPYQTLMRGDFSRLPTGKPIALY